ncbi:hypothetical protein RMB13_07030 [Acinetobacter sp. V102_4]|uniref:hypothetical protein n=1 Tax=Acinetobacter sp. V102_4 TaxID=3072984 RepID=UPI00287E010C|nr:hypothetical protein [Acinetobacter sp. V102_4]MDS7929231.1 hypothetical protein [Acinetobacter sp. V102_4]
MTNKKKSPYSDYLNCEIFEGDLIQHPSGEKGIVVFEQRTESDSDNWLVHYEDGIKSRLCLQVGDKGQAYVIEHEDIVARFGGKARVEEATRSKAIDDVYCWELGKWFNHRYWVEKMENNHTGVTLRELAIAARI